MSYANPIFRVSIEWQNRGVIVCGLMPNNGPKYSHNAIVQVDGGVYYVPCNVRVIDANMFEITDYAVLPDSAALKQLDICKAKGKRRK